MAERSGDVRSDREAVLEVRVPSIDHIFDSRDPAPFRERSLDSDFVEYLLEGGRERAARNAMRIVVRLTQSCAPDEIKQALSGHFARALDRARRLRSEQLRSGWVALAIAAVAVVVLIGLGELLAKVVTGALGSGLREAVTISGWVLMWRPIEVLIYDGIPYRRERRILCALRDAHVVVTTEQSGATT